MRLSRCFLVVLSGLMLAVPAHAFIRGDANQDTAVDIADAIGILSTLFIPGTPPLDCLDAGDVNDDGLLDISDPIYLLGHLFEPGSPPPPVPFPADGADPTPDALGDCDGATGMLDFEVITEGVYCGAAAQSTIIRSQAEWDVFWTGFSSIFFPPPIQPVVDFSTEMVVVEVRHFTSGGFFVRIDALIATPGGIEVHVTQGAPLGLCPVTLALTQPFSIVRAPATPGDPIVSTTIVDTCP